MVIAIILSIAWLSFIVAMLIHIHRTSAKQDALFVMNLGREHINIIGGAYQRAVADGDIRMADLCYNELTALVDEYNRKFEKYGGHYDIRRWIGEE